MPPRSHRQQICTPPKRSPAWGRGGRGEGGGCGNTPQLDRPAAVAFAWAGDLEQTQLPQPGPPNPYRGAVA